MSLTGGTVVFNGENSLADFTGTVANQAGLNLGSGTPGTNGATGITAAAGIYGATVNTGSTRRISVNPTNSAPGISNPIPTNTGA